MKSETPRSLISWPTTIFWVVAVWLLFWQLGGTTLWGSEARWAEVTREMRLTGDYFHPSLNGVPYFDKPLLSYWLIALVAKLSGPLDEWAIRFPSALAALATLWATRDLGRRLWSEQVAQVAGWVLLSGYGFLLWGRMGQADMENLAAVMLAVDWYWARRERPGWADFGVFYLILALGAQTKGLGALVLPPLVLLPDLLREGRWRLLLRPAHWLGLALGTMVYFIPFLLSSWGADQYAGNGLAMVMRENLLRYFEPFDHIEPFYIYFIHLPILMLPWAIALIAAITQAVLGYRGLGGAGANSRWLYWACGLIFLFFSLSGSRRSYYILPIIPFCSLLIGVIATSAEPGKPWRIGLHWQRWLLGLLGLASLLGGLALPWAARHWRVELPISLALSLALIGGAVFALWLSSGRSEAFLARKMALPLGLAFPVCAAALLLGGYFGWQRLVIEDHFRSARRFAQQVRLQAEVDSLAFYRDAPTNLVYYLGAQRPLPVVDGPNKVETLVAAKGGELVLLGTAADLRRLTAELPRTMTSRPIASETAFPWDAKETGRVMQALRLSSASQPPVKPSSAAAEPTGSNRQ